MTWTASETVSEHTQASERTPRRWTKDNKLGEASKTLLKPAPGLKQRNGCGIVCFCCCKCCIGVVPTVRVCIEHIQNCDLRSGMRKRAGVGLSQKEPDLSSLSLHSTHTTYNLARGEFFFFLGGGRGRGEVYTRRRTPTPNSHHRTHASPTQHTGVWNGPRLFCGYLALETFLVEVEDSITRVDLV